MIDRRQRPQKGFTLVEVMATVFLTTLVLTFAGAFYINFSNGYQRATAKVREPIRATTLVDRLARDLEGSYLMVKEPETDPLDHPWLFLAVRELGGQGADRVKFFTRNHRPQVGQRRESDLAQISIVLRSNDDGTYDLLRWVSPRLPEVLDREFPYDDEGAMLMAERLDHFALRFLSETGEWVEEWDSSLLESSGALPVAVEIEARMAPVDVLDALLPGESWNPEESGAPIISRRVLLPIRPVDLLAMVEGEDAGDEADAEGLEGTGPNGCVTVSDCASLYRQGNPVDQVIRDAGFQNGLQWVGARGKDTCIAETPERDALASICGL